MKLLIIGHSVEDHINKSGALLIQPGGIYYTAAALCAVKENDDDLYLCSAIEPDNYNLFAPVYDRTNKLYLQNFQSIPKVHLIINENTEREEYYSNISDPLNIPINDINIFDGILINMITGYDISLEDLQNLRKRYHGIIYIDIHTLARGIYRTDKGIKRNFRMIPDFDKWAESVDIIQVNKLELSFASEMKDETEAANSILTRDNHILLVTKDRDGATGYIRTNETINRYDLNAIQVKEVNKVGCGDIFGAVFFYTYIKNCSITDSLTKANSAAGRAAGFHSLSDIASLKLEHSQGTI